MLSIQVAELMRDEEYSLNLSLVSGKKGLFNKITISSIQRPGLGLTGDSSHLSQGRIQVLGRSEIGYLQSLSPQKLKKALDSFCDLDLAAMVITRGNEPPSGLIEKADQRSIPLFRTNLLTSTFINRVSRFLEMRLTPTTQVHGVMMDVFGVGLLISGQSGIGKSEAALDLILRGHRLVADDSVQIRKKLPASLEASCSTIIKYHMEIRGLGIINIEDLFGVSAIRDQKKIDLVVELVEWDPTEEYDRLGLENQTFNILDIRLPYLKIPVRPGRNMTSIIEVAARNYLLKDRGHHSAKDLEEKIHQKIKGQGSS